MAITQDPSRWLVTGGAGYIGSHVVLALRSAGLTPIVLDDLSTGFSSFVPPDVPLVETSILDETRVRAALTEHQVSGVIHLAGFKYAGVSVKRPLHTYSENVEGTRRLLSAMDQPDRVRLGLAVAAELPRPQPEARHRRATRRVATVRTLTAARWRIPTEANRRFPDQ